MRIDAISYCYTKSAQRSEKSLEELATVWGHQVNVKIKGGHMNIYI